MRLVLILVVFFVCDLARASCFPENHEYIPTTVTASGISEKSFNRALDKVEKYYAPIIEARGAKLQINRLWKDGTVNSDASQENGVWIINSYGGLARFSGMSVNGYMQVACHEMGHHLGGAPKYPDDPWASDEGEADYFSSIRCMKAMGLSEAEINASSLVLAKVLAKLGGESVPSPKKHDPSVVKETNHDHPQAQCRLDTYLAGNVCDKEGDLSESDPSVHTCYDYKKPGVRPLCWFKP